LLWSSALPTLAEAQSPTIAPRITTMTITLPEALEGAMPSFCTWDNCTIGPRLYQAPMAGGSTLIGWTDASGNGHVSLVNGGTIEQTFDFPATPVRGLVVHADNSFAVLLLDFNNNDPNVFDHFMELSLLAADGTPQWTTMLPNNQQVVATPGVSPNPQTFGGPVAGDSRLGYGGGTYGAYFSITAEPDSTGAEHNGDQLSIVNDAGVVQPYQSLYFGNVTGGWGWGLSHSLAGLIDYHPDLARLTALGVTDCYPPNPPLRARIPARARAARRLLECGICCGGQLRRLGFDAAGPDGGRNRWKLARGVQCSE
jgi:hypothetical protein